MIYISHRGNLFGTDPSIENQPEQIDKCISLGYDVEIDVRYEYGSFYLGHDRPDTKISLEFLTNRSDNLWIHCKNVQSLSVLVDLPELNIFWHNKDNYTLTSKQYIWAYPGNSIHNQSRAICVLPEIHNTPYNNFIGICSDYIGAFKD